MSGGKKIFRGGVSETSLTASDLGTPGEMRQEHAKLYQLVQGTVSFDVGIGYQYQNAITGTEGYIVGANHNISAAANGVYNAQTVSVVSNAYFWGQVNGVGAVMMGAASLASNILCRASTAGLVASAVSCQDANCFRTINSITATVTGLAHIFCKEG